MKSFGSMLASNKRGEVITLTVICIIALGTVLAGGMCAVEVINQTNDDSGDHPTGLINPSDVTFTDDDPEIIVDDDDNKTSGTTVIYDTNDGNKNADSSADNTKYTTSHSVTYTYNYSSETKTINLEEDPDWDYPDDYSPVGDVAVAAYVDAAYPWAEFVLIMFLCAIVCAYLYNRFFAQSMTKRY
ncbi:MAG: hypothetical protein WCS17_08065 [Prevotella sp.]